MPVLEDTLLAAIKDYNPKVGGRRKRRNARGGVEDDAAPARRRGSESALAKAAEAATRLAAATASMAEAGQQAADAVAAVPGQVKSWAEACKDALVAKLRSAVHESPGVVASVAAATSVGLYAFAEANIGKILPLAKAIADKIYMESTIPERAADAVPAMILTFAIFATTEFLKGHPGFEVVDEAEVADAIAGEESAAAEAAEAAAAKGEAGVAEVVAAGLDSPIYAPGTGSDDLPTSGGRRRTRRRHRHRPSAPTRKGRRSSYGGRKHYTRPRRG